MVIYRYELPQTIITNNDRQFDNQAFRDFYTELHIRHYFISIDHPQSNQEVEVMNSTILQGLRAKLDESKGHKVDELPGVLWAYHTTPQTLMNKTPFTLAFSIEAMMPIETGLLTIQIEFLNEATN